jgi:hypothetical protein
MGIIYKFYEPDNDYEQIQADLYNNAIGKYGTPGNATADQIEERYRVEGFDNKGVQYAFDDDKPIAYIQTRKVVETKQVYIGYPWSTTDCPEEVKDEMFKNMVDYLYTRDPEYKIVCGVIQDSWTDVRDFLKKYNCTVENEYKTYLLDITNLSIKLTFWILQTLVISIIVVIPLKSELLMTRRHFLNYACLNPVSVIPFQMKKQ